MGVNAVAQGCCQLVWYSSVPENCAPLNTVDGSSELKLVASNTIATGDVSG